MRFHFFCFLAFSLMAKTLIAQDYGLATRPSFSAFNGGVLPPNASSISGSWSAVPVPNWPTFSNPLGIVQEPGTQSMIVWEREGRVYRFDKATGANKTLMLDISANVQGWDDCGMLNLVCHPNYSTNHYLFIYYTWVPAGQIKGNSTTRPPTFTTNWKRLSRFTVKTDGTIDPASETVLVHQKCQALWHSGSGMFFHPDDGFLYFINGDDFVPTKAQKLNGGIFSGIFRIDVDQRGGSFSHAIPRQPLPGPNDNTGSYTSNYFIPNDNPIVGQTGVLEEYFALGVRSPHRLTIDAVTKRMFHSDVGDASREEINVVEPGEILPNYQWPKFEGLVGDMTAPYIGLNKKPIIDYTHADGQAVIGGYVYRGTEFPELVGKYIFGDNMNGTIWYLEESTTPATKVAICKLPNGPGFNSGDNYLGLSSFGVDASGELYMAQMSNGGGRIYKLSRTGGNTNTLPPTLSQTNIFSDLASLTTNTGFIAYDVVTPLWSDAALKKRWFAVPSGQRIGYAATGEWSFPTGSVFVKHFDLGTDETNPSIKRRLETRIIVRDNQGYVYGATYKWRNDLSDADIVNDTQTENLTITTATGTRQQTWTFPGRQACLSCHTPASKGVLGLSTPQNHRDHLFTETGITDNQLRAWNHAGYFTPAIDEATLPTLQKFAAIDDVGASLEQRVRSYLDSNCSHCHRPGGVGRATWDARIETPLASAGIVSGHVTNDLGIPGAQIITPQNVANSILHKRLGTATEPYAMPPIAKSLVDAPAVALLESWINSLTPPVPQPVAAPWATKDLGNTAIPGSAVQSDGRYTLQASGADFGGDSDDVRYVYRDLTGDGTMVVHWVSGSNESVGTLAGITMRETLAANAKQVSIFHMPGQTKFVWRISPTNLNSGHYADMSWLRLRRAGSVFTASISSDGITWTQVGQQTIAMTSLIKVGLCVCGRDNTKLATEVFDNIQFMVGVPWWIDTQPRSQLVRTGDLVEMAINTTGEAPTSYQWRKNGTAISRAVAARYAFNATLASAASYGVLTGGKLASSAANLVVIDKITYTNNLAPKATATFTLSYAGTGATFQWTKDGVPLQNSTRILGAKTSKLTVSALTYADMGDYECVVTAFGTTLVQGPCHLHVLTKPGVTSPNPVAGSVSQPFSWQMTADELVSSYKIVGLPAGLTYNAKTGLISGTPNVGSLTDYKITVTATNAAGAGASRDYFLTIVPFPTSLIGSFAGLVDRDAANNQLGGSLSLTVSSSGTYTLKVTSGTATTSLSSRVLFVPGNDPVITVPNTSPPVTCTLSIANGTISGSAWGAGINARRLVRTATASVFNTALVLPAGSVGNSTVPQGTGWARVIVSTTGAVTVSGRLADGTVITSSHTLRDDGSIAWQQFLYSKHGSIQGTPTIASSTFNGNLSWRKMAAASTSDYTYPGDFGLVDLTVDGVKWAAPVGTTFLGVADAAGNAKLQFTYGGIGNAASTNLPNQTFRLRATHTATFNASTIVNPNKVNMTITATTGYFTGTFYLKDGALSRPLTYRGIFIPGRHEAFGAFTLRQLPGTTTSPILSGSVRVFDSTLP